MSGGTRRRSRARWRSFIATARYSVLVTAGSQGYALSPDVVEHAEVHMRLERVALEESRIELRAFSGRRR